MIKRLYILIITILSASSCVLSYLLFFLPVNHIELILNEKSYMEIINENDFQEILSKGNGINKATSLASRVVQAKDMANKAVEMMVNVHQQLNEAVSLSGYPDSVRMKLKGVSGIMTQISQLGPPMDVLKKFEFESKLSNPQVYSRSMNRGLPVLLLGNELIGMVSAVMDSLAAITEGTNFKFDVLTNIKPTEGPSWVKGQIVFNPPTLMNLYQKERIQVRISKKYSQELVASMARKESTVVSDSLAVGDIMLVKLLGDDFDIITFDDEEQGVTNEGYTQWEFDVTPKSSGNHDLYIKAGIMYYVPNLGAAKKYFPAYDKVIHVEVSTWQVIAGFATTRWEFLLSSIFIPLIVWAFSRWRKRTNKDGTSSS